MRKNIMKKKNFLKSFKKGFTLIELLVVVAIIGILASVVLASLNSARSKGNDAAIKSNLDDMRGQAAIYYDSNSNTYGTSISCTINVSGGNSGCTGLFADPTMLAGLKQAAANSGLATGATLDATTDSFGQLYAVDTALKSDNTKGWCIDSGGKSEQVIFSGTGANVSGASTGTPVALTSCP
jgi:prepilin-type N-terminal cleavage/methylation domain-containing protein